MYDVIIHLKREKLARQHHAVDVAQGTFCPKYKPPEEESEQLYPLPVYDFDPALLYYQELKV